jgi:signal transduction histidine kinase
MTPKEGSPNPRAAKSELGEPKGASPGDLDRLERRIAELTSRIAQLEREKDDVDAFAAVAAHELVQPLVMVEARASMLGERLSSDDLADARQEVDDIGRAAARLRRLVESVLHDARSSGEDLRRERVDLALVLTEVVALLRPEIDTRAAHVVIGPLPAVDGDRALLGSLFMNLLTNALKYGPSGTLIHVGALREGDAWRISFEDNGDPIPEADRERLFEPFQRGRGSRRVRGVGLGLATCRRIAERHGGTIGLTAGANGGTAFEITLPV